MRATAATWLTGSSATRTDSNASCRTTECSIRIAYGTTEELWFPEWEFHGSPWKNREICTFSPHLFADKFKTPTLVIHGQNDYRLDVSEGFQLFTTLQRLKIPSKFLYFPDEGHWVTQAAKHPVVVQDRERLGGSMVQVMPLSCRPKWRHLEFFRSEIARDSSTSLRTTRRRVAVTPSYFLRELRIKTLREIMERSILKLLLQFSLLGSFYSSLGARRSALFEHTAVCGGAYSASRVVVVHRATPSRIGTATTPAVVPPLR